MTYASGIQAVRDGQYRKAPVPHNAGDSGTPRQMRITRTGDAHHDQIRAQILGSFQQLRARISPTYYTDGAGGLEQRPRRSVVSSVSGNTRELFFHAPLAHS